MDACPPIEALQAFVAGTLAEPAAAALEDHLDACEACRAGMSALVRGDGAAGGAPRFGRYAIETVLGSGGMGIVYRAWDPELARAIAIKVVRRAGDPEHRARLVREAQSLARLSHAHVCHVYDVGTDGDEVWLAMELVEGVTLRAWSEGRTAAERLAALRDAARGLAAAHAVGLVHRDVKPENVLVDRAGRAVVTDFGLARADDARASTLPGDAAASPDPLRTASGMIAGTPAYLAPEQLTADAVDARADQFAWATMAWELLTGARPFPAEPAARLAAIRGGLDGARDFRVPELARARIGAVLARALALRPGDRYPTMIDALAALEAATAAPPRRRARAWIGAGVFALAGAAIVGAVTHGGAHEATAPPDAARVAARVIVDAAPAIPIDAAIVIDAAPAVDAAPRPDAAPHPDAAPAGDRVAAVFASGRVAAVAPTQLAAYQRDCVLPTDPTRPDPLQRDAADWGRITRRDVVELASPVVGQGRIAMVVYELRGARGTYHVDGHVRLGNDDRIYDLAVGQLVLRCPDPMWSGDNELYQLPAPWHPLQYTGTLFPLAHPPRIAGALAAAGYTWIAERLLTGKDLPTDRAFVVSATPGAEVDDLVDMGGWFLDPADLGHRDRLVRGRAQWFVVDRPRDETVAPHRRRRVLHGVDVLTWHDLVD